MMSDTYIGRLKSERFDYDVDIKSNTASHFPSPICVCKETRKGNYCECSARGMKLYWDIVHEVGERKANTKQTDWGCFVIKLSQPDLVEWLSREKYKGEVDNMLSIAKGLPDTEEYLLVALELY